MSHAPENGKLTSVQCSPDSNKMTKQGCETDVRTPQNSEHTDEPSCVHGVQTAQQLLCSNASGQKRTVHTLDIDLLADLLLQCISKLCACASHSIKRVRVARVAGSKALNASTRSQADTVIYTQLTHVTVIAISATGAAAIVWARTVATSAMRLDCADTDSTCTFPRHADLCAHHAMCSASDAQMRVKMSSLTGSGSKDLS